MCDLFGGINDDEEMKMIFFSKTLNYEHKRER